MPRPRPRPELVKESTLKMSIRKIKKIIKRSSAEKSAAIAGIIQTFAESTERTTE